MDSLTEMVKQYRALHADSWY